MTLKFMEGFETCADDSDVRLRGWISGSTKLNAAFTPSFTGVAGTSMQFIGTGSTSSSAPPTGYDLGYYNTGVTINSAWLAGGFSMGFSGRFNNDTPYSYASALPAGNNNQICFDGTLYWAIRVTGSTYTLANSPDLRNWTQITIPVTLGTGASVSYLGGGIVAVIGSASGATITVYYTNNSGVSWSTQTVFTLPTSSVNSGGFLQTGNSSFPHLIYGGSQSTSAASYQVGVGAVGGTITSVVSGVANQTYWSSGARARNLSGLLVCLNTSGTIYSATASNSALNTSAAWSTATTSLALHDIAYNPVSNVFVLAHHAGISIIPNTGAAGTPVAPTGTLSPTLVWSGLQQYNVHWTGTQLVTIGANGLMLTSPDGTTWTSTAGHIIPSGVPFNWQNAYYDGSRYVLCSDASSGVIATSPDLSNNFAAQYVMDAAEAIQSVNYWGTPGFIVGVPGAGTAWTSTSNAAGWALHAVSSGTRVIYCGVTTTNAGNFTANNAVTSPVNYYEIVGKSVAGTANSFVMTWFFNGTQVASATYALGTGTGDTTSVIVLTPGRMNSLAAFDDWYLNVIDGQGLSGQLGSVNILAQRPTTDVSDQWVKNGSAASNALSVNQTAYSSQTTNFVSSANAGDKDVYSTTATIPAGYTAKAIQTEACFGRTSGTIPVVTLGVSSGGVESDTPTVSVTSASGATFVSQVLDKNPNGSVAWTNAAVNATQFVLNHVS